MSARKFIGLNYLVVIGALGIWLGSGHQVYLFIAGVAFGAVTMGSVIAWDERKNLKAQIKERLDA